MKHMLTVGLLVLAVSCFAENDSPQAGATDTNMIAFVLGKKITTGEKEKLNGLIFSCSPSAVCKGKQDRTFGGGTGCLCCQVRGEGETNSSQVRCRQGEVAAAVAGNLPQ